MQNNPDNYDHLVWHPYTQEKLSRPNIEITKALGSSIHAKNGEIIIDAISSWWVNIHGHSHPHIAAAIARQAAELEHVIFAGFTHQPATLLAKNLIELLPKGFAKVFYSDNGSTAVEVAIKMAIQFHSNAGKKIQKIIAFENSYHGDTFGAMAVSSRGSFHEAFEDLLFEVIYLPIPTADNLNEVCKFLSDTLKKEKVAAFIYEPLLQAAGGMKMYAAEYLEKLLQIAKAHDCICIADEVLTGFGRTGYLFASEAMETKPDIICLSKGITGGFMPLGVTVCQQHIYDAFYSDDRSKTFFHGHSYTANPIACAAANASAELLMLPSCRENIDRITARHESFSEKLMHRKSVTNIRCLGTVIAFDCVNKESTGYFNNIRDTAYQFFLSKNILMRPLGNVLYLMPPYCITDDELVICYEAIEEFCGTLEGQHS